MTTRGAVLKIGAGYAAAMGLARFVYTPLLPIMQDQAGLSRAAGAQIATANYVGYLLGAALTMVLPATGDSRKLYRWSLVLLVAGEAVMAAVPIAATGTPGGEPGGAPVGTLAAWWILRLAAGFASGIVFIRCSRAVGADPSLGAALAGVGAGIVLSGLLSAAGHAAGLDWRGLWLLSAVVTALLCVPAARAPMFGIQQGKRPAAAEAVEVTPGLAPARAGRAAKGALIVSYLGEGAGYIIIGTFIVAAVAQAVPGRAAAAGNLTWMVAGAAVVASMPCWRALRSRFHELPLLVAALLLQAGAAFLPALWPGIAGGMVSAALFGGTFVGIVQLTLAYGVELGIRNSAAVLVTAYSVGQIIGPVAVAPAIAHGDAGYRGAFAVAGVVLVISAVLAACARERRRTAG